MNTTLFLLSFLLGGLGMDHFYLGCTMTGVLKLLTGGGFGIWWLIDVISIATGKNPAGCQSGGARSITDIYIALALFIVGMFTFYWYDKFTKSEVKY